MNDLTAEHLKTPGITDALQASLGPQYRVEREVGRGGMGVVYLARDLTLDRLVAVKVVHPDLSTNRTVAARFLTEARTIAKLRHPGIVAVHTAGEVDGQLYYVMDYLPGETLRQRLAREHRLDLDIAVRIASEIAEALDAASSAGVVHRDLKPENVLLDGPADEPRAMLADFGIARLVEGGGGHTGPGAVMGTPAYMSPEQAAGEDLDGRSDLYSLGVVTYEMLTGSPPFTGAHRAVISKQIIDPAPPIEQHRPGIPPHVAATVMRSLEKVPEARWPTGKAFRKALIGQELTPTPTTNRNRATMVRRFLPALVGVALATLAIIGLLNRRDGPPAGLNPRLSMLVLPFDNLRQDPQYEWLRDGSVNMLSLALSQWHDLTVVDQDRVHDLLSIPGREDGPIGLELARRLARESRVWTVVLGDFSRVGDSLHLVARRYDVATGNRLDLVRVAGLATDDVRPLFDQLATRLLDLAGAPQNGRPSLTSVTTASLEAYRAYLNGLDALNHWRLTDASRALSEAVRLDSTFSLANYKLAIARGWMSAVDTVGFAAIRRAARTSEPLPPRERALIEGYRTFIDNDYDRGFEIYGDLVRKDSTDTEAWYGMADAAFHDGYSSNDVARLNQSLRGFRRVLGLDSSFALAYEHIGALLNDAGATRGWIRLVGSDSLSAREATSLDSAGLADARKRAINEAVSLAEAWTRLQPNTPRAHYHLYKAQLTDQREADARETLQRLRSLQPDSLQALFGLMEARALFADGDIRGSAETVRRILPNIRPRTYAGLDLATEPVIDMMTGVGALGYLGDIGGAAELIRLGAEMRRGLPEARDSAEKAREDDLWEYSRLALIYAASGSRSDRLRSIWQKGISLAKGTDPKSRAPMLEMIVPAAIGLLIGPPGDAAAVTDLERLTGQQSPRSVRALIAARSGDSVAARRLLAEITLERPKNTLQFDWESGMGDQRPLMAEAHFELGDYAAVVSTLARFQSSSFGTRGIDSRWIVLPRVRLLRGQALERLGRAPEAAVEYRAVIDQWAEADAELLPVVQRARQRLAVVTGPPEGRG